MTYEVRITKEDRVISSMEFDDMLEAMEYMDYRYNICQTDAKIELITVHHTLTVRGSSE